MPRNEDRLECINKELKKIELTRANQTKRVKQLKSELAAFTTNTRRDEMQRDEFLSKKSCKQFWKRTECRNNVQAAKDRLNVHMKNVEDINVELRLIEEQDKAHMFLLTNTKDTKERIIRGPILRGPIIRGPCDHNKIEALRDEIDRKTDEMEKGCEQCTGGVKDADCSCDEELDKHIRLRKRALKTMEENCDGLGR